MADLYPMLLAPALHVKIWGGRRLESELHKSLPTSEPYGESWELHDTCTVTNGSYAGRTLGDLIGELGAALVGEGNNPADGFPLLAKFIDASKWLSIQVHPNDEQARELEGDPRGKTEAWFILAAETDAQLAVGVTPGTTREAMAQAIQNDQFEAILAYAPVKAGDVFYIRANTIHAIGPGVMLYEIQQSSNVTYRLYDWGRMDLNGKPRELHIEKGVRVANIDTLPEVTHPTSDTDEVPMVNGEYFVTVRYDLEGGSKSVKTAGKFHALTCIDGAVTVVGAQTTIQLGKGQTALIPAALPDYQIMGSGKVLCSFQP